MEVIITPDPASAASLAAGQLAAQLQAKPSCVLGLATGNTMVGIYAELARRHRQEQLDFSRATTFNLDEYVGLAPGHPCSYASFMRTHLFDQVNLDPRRINLPDGMTADVPGFCAHYEQAIEAAGGIDLQLLGIGRDGHIGFNEPSSSLGSRTRIKTLTPLTRTSNRRHFPPGDDVPMHVLTMGVATIMEARRCVLVALGAAKAAAVKAAVEGPVSAMCPASALQWHPRCTFILDEAAAGELALADYYRFAHEHRPAWQR